MKLYTSVLLSVSVLFSAVACNSATTESASESQTSVEASTASDQEMKSLITPSEFLKYKNSGVEMVVLDVRTPAELQSGIIEGAQHIDFRSPNFQELIKELDKDKTYMVYCASGGRSNSTANMMKELGFDKVMDLKGGIRAWNGAGLPTVSVN